MTEPSRTGPGLPSNRRVFLLIHNPTIPFERSRKLNRVLGWNDPDTLTQRFIEDIAYASHGAAQFIVERRVEVNAFPLKQDGFAYTPKSYLNAWRMQSGFHTPDDMDYHLVLEQFEILPGIRDGEFDEVWLFGFPYQGCYESVMGGPNAFWCNAPPLPGTALARRRFVIMAFNYERGPGEMLESFGHRAESIMAHIYRNHAPESNRWLRFSRCDLTHPGKAQVGTIHLAPNSQRDYDWGNRHLVWSGCDDWLHASPETSEPREVNCMEWGGGDMRLHHLWWFQHLPHFEGETDGIANNWWKYILDPDRVL